MSLLRDMYLIPRNTCTIQYNMRHTKRVFTKKRMTHVAIRMPHALRDVLRVAASREEISQSDFLRRAIEERAQRVLTGKEKMAEARGGNVL
jgi:hypothetical protein